MRAEARCSLWVTQTCAWSDSRADTARCDFAESSARNASTAVASNCGPLPRMSSLTDTSYESARRWGLSEVIAAYTSATQMIRASRRLRCPERPLGYSLAVPPLVVAHDVCTCFGVVPCCVEKPPYRPRMLRHTRNQHQAARRPLIRHADPDPHTREPRGVH